jgi:hypothetical protein
MSDPPTRERLAELAKAANRLDDDDDVIGHLYLMVSELRWLLAQAERLAAMRPAPVVYAPADEEYSPRAYLAGYRAAERRLLAPPPQPSTLTSSTSVEHACGRSVGVPLDAECLPSCGALGEAREESER